MRTLECILMMMILVGCAAPERSPSAAPELRVAIEQIERGAPDQGLAALRTFLADVPPDAVAARAEAHRWAGHVLTLLGRPEEAIADYRAALALEPRDAWSCYALGVALESAGELEASLAGFSRAIEIDEGHLKARQWRGQVLALLGRHREAIEEDSRTLALLAATDDARLGAWGARRNEISKEVLLARARSHDALAEHALAEHDRQRALGTAP